MYINRPRRLFVTSLLGISFLLMLSGCYSPLQESSSAFGAQTAKTASLLSDYYTQLNNWYRDIYLDELSLHPREPMLKMSANTVIKDPSHPGQTIQLPGQPTGLIEKYSPDTINARVKAIQALSLYAKRLVELATNSSSKDMEQQVALLGSQIVQTDKELQAIHDNYKSDSLIAQYAGPVSSLAGLVTSQVLKSQQEKALKAAIIAGKGPMKSIIQLLKTDLTAIQDNIGTKAEKVFVGQAQAYNDATCHADETLQQCVGKEKQRADLRLSAKESLNRYLLIRDASPLTSVEDLEKVYNNLWGCAENQCKSPQDFANLISAIDAYTADLEKANKALSELETNAKK